MLFIEDIVSQPIIVREISLIAVETPLYYTYRTCNLGSIHIEMTYGTPPWNGSRCSFARSWAWKSIRGCIYLRYMMWWCWCVDRHWWCRRIERATSWLLTIAWYLQEVVNQKYSEWTVDMNIPFIHDKSDKPCSSLSLARRWVLNANPMFPFRVAEEPSR